MDLFQSPALDDGQRGLPAAARRLPPFISYLFPKLSLPGENENMITIFSLHCLIICRQRLGRANLLPYRLRLAGGVVTQINAAAAAAVHLRASQLGETRLAGCEMIELGQEQQPGRLMNASIEKLMRE